MSRKVLCFVGECFGETHKLFISLSVNLTAFIFGIVIGFTGPNLELFKSEDSPLASGLITTEEESWISSLAAFGAIGFVLIYGWISEKFGRRLAILLIGVPQTVKRISYLSAFTFLTLLSLLGELGHYGACINCPSHLHLSALIWRGWCWRFLRRSSLHC